MRLAFWRKQPKYAPPLSPADAHLGEVLAQFVPPGRLYRLGLFYCDKSPDSHTDRYSHAVDLLVPDGTLVYASRAGTVVDLVEDNTIYGKGPSFAKYLNYVTIDHHDGFYSQYAHLAAASPASYGIHVGKQVVRGQALAKVGKCGWVDFGDNGDHLHFMVFRTDGDSFISVPVTFAFDDFPR